MEHSPTVRFSDAERIIIDGWYGDDCDIVNTAQKTIALAFGDMFEGYVQDGRNQLIEEELRNDIQLIADGRPIESIFQASML